MRVWACPRLNLEILPSLSENAGTCEEVSRFKAPRWAESELQSCLTCPPFRFNQFTPTVPWGSSCLWAPWAWASAGPPWRLRCRTRGQTTALRPRPGRNLQHDIKPVVSVWNSLKPSMCVDVYKNLKCAYQTQRDGIFYSNNTNITALKQQTGNYKQQ